MLWRGPVGGGSASGKLGAMVASHNSGGQYLRARTTPTNPNSVYQAAVRAALGSLSNSWVTFLTQAQRDGWELYGRAVNVLNRLGDSIKISGLAHFIRSNVPRVQAGLSLVDVAPTTLDVGETPIIDALVVDASSDNVQVTLGAVSNPWLPDANRKVLCYVSPPQNPTINFYGGPFRFAGITSATTSALTFTNPFAAVAGQSTFVSLRISNDDGRLSASTQDRAIVQA